MTRRQGAFLVAVLLATVVIVVALAGPYEGRVRYSQGTWNVAPTVGPEPEKTVPHPKATGNEPRLWWNYQIGAGRVILGLLASVAVLSLVVFYLLWALRSPTEETARERGKRFHVLWYVFVALALLGLGVPIGIGIGWLVKIIAD